ncbi:unnamed protein product [Ilex paraguariensis]|uniref:DUF4220 domain-containing protein n=1 Tax=Ilex paraguariensis TaxID=185542 RepID=A0ABC8U4W7_9AQUA
MLVLIRHLNQQGFCFTRVKQSVKDPEKGMEILPPGWKKLWEIWDIRSFIILSLSLQTFLIFFSSLRKRTASKWVIMPLWSAYLLADWAAGFAVGLISNSQGKTSGDNNADLLAFWAPFLLVHLGGPDPITAFALEDNELWLRHLLALLVQCLAAVYVFIQSLPNKLWIPTLLMLLAGIIKYAERTRSLYLASMDSFRESMNTKPNPGPNYAKLMDEYYSKKEARLPTRIEMIAEPDRVTKAVNKVKEGPLTDLEVVHYAYRNFESFKGLIVDLIFSFRERNQSREFFLKRSAKDAFKVIEVELNFIYEVLYTKVSVVHSGLGYIFRFISITSVVVALVLFHSKKKDNFKGFDVGITYTLLLGAIALDVIALAMFLFSDRTVVALHKLPENKVENMPEDTYTEEEPTKSHVSCFNRLMRLMRRRWSESISTYNLIYFCLHPRRLVKDKLVGYLGLRNFLDGLKYVGSKPFNDELRDHIFDELLAKSEIADDLETAKEICSSRGDWILRVENRVKNCNRFLPWILDVDYDESLLLWHIATELCYNTDDVHDPNKDPNKDRNVDGNEEQKKDFRKISKLLSDYMLYLVVMQPTMMSAVAGIGQIRFQDTCAEAKKFFGTGNFRGRQDEANICEVIIYVILSFFKYLLLFFILPPILIFNAVKKPFGGAKAEQGQVLLEAYPCYLRVMKFFGKEKLDWVEQQKEACRNILAVNTEVKPVTVKGDRSKSVLFDACLLAKKLKELEGKDGEPDKWEIMSKVWVELLSYAACHCRANAHAAQLSSGGQLISVVWLLMAHLGLGDQFQINEGNARAKLIVEK